jgi:hypothetical protein
MQYPVMVHKNVDVKEFRKLFACLSYEMYPKYLIFILTMASVSA